MNTHPYLPEPSVPPIPLPIPMVPVREVVRWEYRRLLRDLRTEEAPDGRDLDRLGGDGWELVGVAFDSPFLYMYFKRPA